MFKELLNQETVKLHSIAQNIKNSLLDAFQVKLERETDSCIRLYKNGLSNVVIYIEKDHLNLSILGSLPENSYDAAINKGIINKFKTQLKRDWNCRTGKYGTLSIDIQIKNISTDLIHDIVKILENMDFKPRVQGSNKYF